MTRVQRIFGVQPLHIVEVRRGDAGSLLGFALGKEQDRVVQVNGLIPNSAAAESGLKLGAWLYTVNGTRVYEPPEAYTLISQESGVVRLGVTEGTRIRGTFERAAFDYRHAASTLKLYSLLCFCNPVGSMRARSIAQRVLEEADDSSLKNNAQRDMKDCRLVVVSSILETTVAYSLIGWLIIGCLVTGECLIVNEHAYVLVFLATFCSTWQVILAQFTWQFVDAGRKLVDFDPGQEAAFRQAVI
jgi:hypothetical protein